jgi:hypothetical protein
MHRRVAAAVQWPWLNRVFAAWVMVMLALWLGVLSFAAVREMTVECGRKPSYLLTANGDPVRLVDGISRLELAQKRLQCRVAMGDAFAVTIP